MIRKYTEGWYDSVRTIILLEQNGDIYHYESFVCENHRRDYFVARKNGKEIAQREYDFAAIKEQGVCVLSKNESFAELNGEEMPEEEYDELDFDEFVDTEERTLLLMYGHGEEILAAEAKAVEEEKAREEAAARREAEKVEKAAARYEREQEEFTNKVNKACKGCKLADRKKAHKAVRFVFGDAITNITAEQNISRFTIAGKEGWHEIEYNFMPWLS